MKIYIKKGDLVRVIAGSDKGKEGRVLSIVKDKYRAFVEGVGVVSRHTKPNAKNPNGGIVKKEAPIHISNLMLIDPKSGKPTRISRERVDGKPVRKSKKSGEVIK
jgi:large subunit ribosomal protein L24